MATHVHHYAERITYWEDTSEYFGWYVSCNLDLKTAPFDSEQQRSTYENIVSEILKTKNITSEYFSLADIAALLFFRELGDDNESEVARTLLEEYGYEDIFTVFDDVHEIISEARNKAQESKT